MEPEKTHFEEVEKSGPPQGTQLIDTQTEAQVAEPHLNWRVIPVTVGFWLTWCAWQCTFNLLSSVLTYVNEDIGPDTNYTWAIIVITIDIAVVWPISGSLSDTLGRRYFFLVGLTFSIVGAIIACTAKSISVLIVANTILGIGTAMHQMVLAGISEIYPNKWRGIAISSINFVSTPFAGVGPYIAHIIVERLSWRWLYFVAIIIDVVAFLMLAIFYHPPKPNRTLSRRQLLKKIDFVGLGLFALGLTVFLVGVSWAGGQFSWRSAAVLVPMIGGGAVLVAYGFWAEVYGTKNPLFPPFLFKDIKGFTNVLLICFVASMPLMSSLTFWPIQVANLYTTDALKIGLYTVPLTLGTVFGGVLTATIRWWRPTNYYLTACAVLLTIFTGLLSTLGPGDLKKALAYVFLYGTGVGLCEIAIIVVIQFSTTAQHLGTVTGLLSSMRGIAGALGISVYSSILSTRLGADLPKRLAAATLPLGLPESSFPILLGAVFTANFTSIPQIPGITPDIIQATTSATKLSWAYSFKPIYWLGSALGVVAVVLSYFTRDISSKMDNQLDVDLKDHELSHLHDVLHHQHHHQHKDGVTTEESRIRETV
ncbi:uncharacterized protein A1O5_00795 [Cladophialophora psammophila CBS 110553]|uniref:Major facilitator superfamily (MFS) profile domain-containing protein n=1 Tax=Cladophialophora psammophila CBS 110553 TaxID=1182543 RepID=W9X739_9EURO|nr:uncharacterized protein A1O5_00795 [Cladophialophora psammophila CBS 110553]EXJ76287.1 hypothetical protein A1O5_00795 [Cladophialophora psammophila CBS 110553]